MTPAKWQIRKLAVSDVDSVVDIHMRSFKGFFLTFLGRPFLHELYAALVTDPSGICFVAETEKGLCGFVAGTDQPSGFYRRLIVKRWWRFALASVIPFLKQPSIAPRLFSAFSRPSEVVQKPNRGTLMSLAVLPEMTRQGIGQLLVEVFLEAAGKRGLTEVDLTTDKENNEVVNHFYLNLGFLCERTFITPEGRAMNGYVKTLLK